jgi:tetratricopeptide (TPR) repeat protein
MNKFVLFVYIFLFSKASISSENLESTICKQKAHEIAANKGITSPEDKIKLWKNYEQQCSSSGIYQLLLGDFYGSYGYYNEAKQILEKTIENKQYDTREHKLLLQSIYQALGEIENLKNLTKKMIVEYPNWSGSFYSLGNYCCVIEEWNNAKKYLEKAVELSDETAELSAIYLKLALVFL